MKWNYVTAAFLVLFAVAAAEGEIWEEDDHEVLIRSERGAKNKGGSNESCRYVKGPWTECDPKTTSRTRTLTLKKGDPAQCEPTKTIQKKCKKACRYEKGTWSECNSQSQMVRVDKLKSNSDSSCEQSREITRKCKTKPGKTKNTKSSNYQSNSNRKSSSVGGIPKVLSLPFQSQKDNDTIQAPSRQSTYRAIPSLNGFISYLPP